MSWNYRVVRQRWPSGEQTFEIHEVYYDDATGRVKAWTENPVSPCGESYLELIAALALYETALTRAVLSVEESGNALDEVGLRGKGKATRVWTRGEGPPGEPAKKATRVLRLGEVTEGGGRKPV